MAWVGLSWSVEKDRHLVFWRRWVLVFLEAPIVELEKAFYK